MSEASNTLEVLINLIYLATHSTKDPQVIEYLREAEACVMKLAAVNLPLHTNDDFSD